MAGGEHRLQSARNAELAQDLADMDLHRPRRDDEPLADVLVGQSFTQQVQHVELALRELGQRARD